MSKAFIGYAPRPAPPPRSMVPWQTHKRSFPDQDVSRALPVGAPTHKTTEYVAEYVPHDPGQAARVAYFPRQDPTSKQGQRHFQPRAPRPSHPVSIRAPLGGSTTIPLSPSPGLTAPVPVEAPGKRAPIYTRHQQPRDWAHSGLRTFPGYGNRSTLSLEHVWVPMKFDYGPPATASQ